MIIKKLDWDSDFFGYNVFEIIAKDVDMSDLLSVQNELKDKETSLVYIFTNSESKNLLKIPNCYLVDCKVTFKKKITQVSLPDNSIFTVNSIEPELLELVYLSGSESRFKKDKRLAPNFKRLYNLWIENSVHGDFAEKVFVYKNHNVILGFISVSIKKEIGQIGLVAVNESHHGHGIGKRLILGVEYYLNQLGIRNLIVVTQKNNDKAMAFYSKLDFEILSEEHVFHWWLK